MIKPILKWPDKKLHERSVEVFPSDFEKKGIKEIVQDMWDTLYDSTGVGLAAIQIGIPFRICVINIGKKEYVLINPIITATSDIALLNEGCLSIPTLLEQMSRYTNLSVAYFDENGESKVTAFSGMAAQAVQHEIDHMDGVLLTDKLGPAARARLASKLAKAKEEP